MPEPSYTLEAAWPTPSEQTKQDVMRFWATETQLPEKVRRERAEQLLAVARTANGEVAGVTTTFRYFVRDLGFQCYFYRVFVAPKHRQARVFIELSRKSFDILQERFDKGIDSDVLGIYMEVENEILNKVYKLAVVESPNRGGLVYFGRTPQGRTKRIWYFKGARLPANSGGSDYSR